MTVSEHNPRSREYSPAHATLVYENQEQQVAHRVHVYYNARGQIININAKSNPLNEANLQNAVPIELSQTQKTLVQEETNGYHELLQRMLNKKDKDYSDLYQQSFELNNELATAVASGRKQLIIAKANELKAIALKLTAYNDTLVDGRIRFLNRYLEKIFVAEVQNIGPSSQPAVVNEVASEPEENVSKGAGAKFVKVPKKLSKEEQTVIDLKNNIKELINQMRAQQEQEPGLSEAYLNLWQELDFQVLTLELCADVESSEEQFIREQRNKLSYKTKLVEYYEQCIDKGKVAEVKKIQPVVEEANNVYSIYYQLFVKLEHNQSVQRCTRDWVDMAEFFFEHSGIFNQVYTMKNMLLSYSSEEQFGYGFLLKLYMNNNLPAFTLFIKHCSETPPAAYMFKNHMFGFMHALIALADVNPNPVFIKLALAQGMMLNAIRDTRLASAQEVRRLLPREDRRRVSNVSMPQSFDQASNFLFAHATVYAMNFYHAQKHPKLIRALFPYASIEHMVLGIARIINANKIISRHLMSCARSVVRSFNSKAECDAQSMQFMNTPGDDVVLFFYPAENNQESFLVMKFCTELLDELKHKINQLEFNDEAKRALLHTLLRTGKNELHDVEKGGAYLSAAQIIYIHITSKTAADDEAMLESMQLIVELLPPDQRPAFQAKNEAFRRYIEDKKMLKEVQVDAELTPQVLEQIVRLIGANPFSFFPSAGEETKPAAQIELPEP